MSEQLTEHFDVIIVGGGMAGATMALALAPLNLNIAIIETHPYQQQQTQPSFDDRCLALAWSSRQIYHTLGVWDELAKRDEGGFAAIKQIHISDRGHWGVTRLDQRQEGVPALGYVVESRVIGEVLIGQVRKKNNVRLFCPAQIEHLQTSPESVQVRLAQPESDDVFLSAPLLIVADGVNSTTREVLGIAINQRSYAQSAIIANIETELPHNNVAYERFTDSGPLALLPLTRDRCSLVWTAREEQVDVIMSLNNDDFRQALQQRFGFRLGQIGKIGRRSSYPLSLMTVDSDTLKHQHRVALIGNAAHGVHPVAGQGFNLGLRDISALAELIAGEMQHKNADPGNERLLHDYWQWRQADIRQVTTITNSLIKLFSNNSNLLALMRNSGLLLTDIISPLKHAIAHEAMGSGVLQGKLSKMAVGQSLF